jgi:hypothetical protein
MISIYMVVYLAGFDLFLAVLYFYFFFFLFCCFVSKKQNHHFFCPKNDGKNSHPKKQRFHKKFFSTGHRDPPLTHDVVIYLLHLKIPSFYHYDSYNPLEFKI